MKKAMPTYFFPRNIVLQLLKGGGGQNTVFDTFSKLQFLVNSSC